MAKENPLSTPLFQAIGKIDCYLKAHLARITGKDFSDAYTEHFERLKTIQGNSEGFTGLSELLILRFLLQVLPGPFEPEERSNQTLWEFKSKSQDHLRVCHTVQIQDDAGKKQKPDFSIWKGEDDLIAVIEVKLWLVQGLKTAREAIDRLKRLHGRHQQMRALLITYYDYSQKLDSQKYRQIKEEVFDAFERECSWGRVLILQNWTEPLLKTFRDLFPNLPIVEA
jgi:hypothetical protein